jgi:peptide chain release factor 2
MKHLWHLNDRQRAWKSYGRSSRSSEGIFDPPALKQRIEELEVTMGAAGFWDKAETAQKTLKEHKELKRKVERFEELDHEVKDLSVLEELASEDESLQRELEETMDRLAAEVKRFALSQTLSGEHDRLNAIVTIHPGAGGTEAQDWAEMLFRMYSRWVERSDAFKLQILDLQPGEEAGIKSVDLLVEGEYAYGYLQSESGVHRLVRISPFDASGRRHTSFASVFVTPEIDDEVEVEINENDLRIDTFRSGGAGGQHVNVTDSAVRIVHKPTGIVVQCQNERSQIKNRSTAMKILRSRLYDYYMAQKKEEIAKREGEKKEIGFGSQIRSYTLQPYRLIKDHRTGLEVGNVDAVLDGGIDPFVEAYLNRGQH